MHPNPTNEPTSEEKENISKNQLSEVRAFILIYGFKKFIYVGLTAFLLLPNIFEI
jgi:hypothetical protein